MISGFPNAIYNRPGKDEEIEKVIQSIRAAGKVGLPVVEYNWYAHRAMEGYFEETGRAGAGWTGFDYERMKDLPPLADGGRPHARRDVDQHHLLPQGGGARGGEGGRAPGAASQRSAGADQPRLAADHGHRGRLEEADRHRQEPVERHHVRLRRDARDGRRSGRGLPLLRARATASTTCISAT